MTHPLLNGFAEFRKYAYEGANAPMPQLVSEGQNPDYYVISCGDSRSNPSTMFNTNPGEIFGFKPIGTIVRPYEQGTALASSLHFAMKYLEIPELIIMGHTECGAVKALVQNLDDPEIASFVSAAQRGLDRAKARIGEQATEEQVLRATEKEIVLQSIENVKGYPAVADALENRGLVIRGWIFDMKSGNLHEYNPDSRNFEPLTNFSSPSAPSEECGCHM